jgi:hypothetical protein
VDGRVLVDSYQLCCVGKTREWVCKDGSIGSATVGQMALEKVLVTKDSGSDSLEKPMNYSSVLDIYARLIPEICSRRSRGLTHTDFRLCGACTHIH